MSDPFVSAGSGVKITDFDGKLLLLEVTGHESGITTQYGEKDAIVADVTVLDGDNTEEHSGVYVFQSKLIGTLKRYINGRPYLGRLEKSKESKNGNRPWVFAAATNEDKDAARAYLKERESKSQDPFA